MGDSSGDSVKSPSPRLSLKPSPLFSPREGWIRELFQDRQLWCLSHIPTSCQTLALGCSFCILPVDNMTPVSCLISWVVSCTTRWPARAFCERSEGPSCLAATDRTWEITADLRSRNAYYSLDLSPWVQPQSEGSGTHVLPLLQSLSRLFLSALLWHPPLHKATPLLHTWSVNTKGLFPKKAATDATHVCKCWKDRHALPSGSILKIKIFPLHFLFCPNYFMAYTHIIQNLWKITPIASKSR